MSLKAIHILFVTLCTLLSFGVAAWAVRAYLEHRAPGDLAMAFTAVAAGVALIIYFPKVLKKMKDIGYL